MLINLRNAMMAGRRLPYDAEVEYLESTETQWIDTGVYWSLGDSLKIVTAQTQVVDQAAFGVAGKIYGFCTGLGGNSSRTFYWGNAPYAGGGPYVLPTAYGTAIHTITIGTDYCDVDGTSVAATSSAIDTSDSLHTVVLFSRADNTATTRLNKTYNGRIYSFQYWKNGVLVRDFIPVRRGTVGYLYDRVTGKLFGNAGTGDFVLGPDVVPVEYIESHGTEWIDTGVIGNSSTKVELKAQGTNTSALQTLCGGRDSNGLYSFAVWQRSNLSSAYGMRWDYLTTNSGGGGGGYILDGVWNTSQPNLVVKDGANNYLNGVQLGANASNSFSCNFPLALFAMNTGGSKANFFVGKMFMCKIFNNNTPTRNYTSVRVGTEGAMMDVLTRRIYRNAGTGAFTYGNDLKYPIPAE